MTLFYNILKGFNMKLKRFFAAAMAALMLSGCNGNAAEDIVTETQAVSAEPVIYAADESVLGEIRDFSSMELIGELVAGWNLGNTLDATGTGLESETAWGNPKTTKEMLDTIKAAGFNLIRIPVTWTGHLDAEDNIDPEWMARVTEVVNYAIDDNTYVIINLHHEDWNYAFGDNKEKAVTKIKKIWSQIAENFKDYDEHLIFEGQNEPRMKGSDKEWGAGDDEGWDVVNSTNAAFVETVRASGGNNAKRHLMIPGYCATSDSSGPERIILPENDDKIIVSVHAYLPYGFALDTNKAANKFAADRPASTADIQNLVNTLKTGYIDKGIAVIIGETGAMNKDNLEARIEWAGYYTSVMREIGVTCTWWDNGSFFGSGENFGLINRKDNTWFYPEVAKAFVEGAGGTSGIQ